MALLALQSRDPEKLCAKRFLADGTVKGYGSPTWWIPIYAPKINGLDQLYTTLQRLRSRPDLLIVRGGLIDINAKSVRRAWKPKTNPKTGIVSPPGLKDVDRAWMVADLDTLAPPPELRAELQADPSGGLEKAGRWAQTQLPAWLQDADCIAQWSNSAGRDGYAKLKMHIFFWLDRAVCSDSLSAYAATIPVLDPATCRSCQPIYTADPIIEDGWTGAPQTRIVLMRGNKRAASPPPEIMSLEDWEYTLKLRDQERRDAAEVTRLIQSVLPEAAQRTIALRRFHRIVQRALEAMASAPESRRHDTLLSKAASIARSARELGINPYQDLEALARVAIARLPSNRSAEVGLAIAYALRTNA